MKKIVIFFMLAGCELFNVDNKSETPNTSNASESSKVQNPGAIVKFLKGGNLVPSEQDLKNLWIENLKSTDIYYADGSGGISGKTTVSDQGVFSISNGSSVRTFFLIKANSSTEACYSYYYYYNSNIIFQANVLLKIVSYNDPAFSEVIRATYTNNHNAIGLDGFETDILYRNP